MRKILFIAAFFLLIFSATSAQAASGCCKIIKETAVYEITAFQEVYMTIQSEDCDKQKGPNTEVTFEEGKVASADSKSCEDATGTTGESQPSKPITPQLQVSLPGFEKFSDVTCDNPEVICEIPWIAEYIKAFYNYGLAIIGVLSVIVMMIGGIIRITAGGNNAQISHGNQYIKGSILGIIFAFCSYSILFLLNPNLTILKPINVSYLNRIDPDIIMADIKNGEPISQEASELIKNFDKDGIISHTIGKSAESYKNQNCNRSIFSGGAIEFFTTGYYKPPYENSQKFFCDVGLQCSCPSGSSQIGPNKGLCKHNYKYCSPFVAGTPYCNKTASGIEPQVGHIAADGSCFNFGDKICLGGKITLTVTDRGSAIKGRRFDIFSGEDRNAALAKTGIALVTLGACP